MLKLMHPNYGEMLIRPQAIRVISHWVAEQWSSHTAKCRSTLDFGDGPHVFEQEPEFIAQACADAGMTIISAVDARTERRIWINRDEITALRREEKYFRIHVGRGHMHYSDALVRADAVVLNAIEGK